MGTVDLRRLRYFVIVAEEGNVSRAARRLCMSQPPLSQRIRELEAELGCELFVRTPRGMLLTSSGEVLLKESKLLLAAAERAVERVRDATGTQSFRIGVLGPGELALSERVAEEFGRDYPKVQVSLRQGCLGDPTAGLSAGEVDVAITWAPLDEGDLCLRIIRTERCFAAISAQDPLVGKFTISHADLAERRSVRLPESADPIWRAFWQPTIHVGGPVVSSLEECLHSVLWHQTVALVPELATRGRAVQGIVYRLVAGLPPGQLVLAWRRADRSPLLRGYVDAFLASKVADDPAQ